MKRCLIIDKSSVIRKVARMILEDIGTYVLEAETGKQGLEICNMILPETILLDWQLPDLGAYLLMQTLKERTSARKPFIIYCTTDYNRADIAHAYALGADEFLMKPFTRKDLISSLKLTLVAA